MKKKKLFIIVSVVLPIFLIIYLLMNDYSVALKINWGISIPYMSFYRETYQKNSGSSFNGDGTRYHVFSYLNEKYIEKMFNWESEEKETELESSYSEFIKDQLDIIGVPKKQRPEY